jgi:hypothetical protein
MKHILKHRFKPGAMALGFGLMLTTLCQAQWEGEHQMTGYLMATTTVAAVQIPGEDVLQLFYEGQDGALWTLWRNQYGSWNDKNQVSMGGQPDGTPVAIQIPNTYAIEVLYRGRDSHLRGFLRNADGSWTTTEQDFGGTVAGNLAVVAVPGTNNIEVFYRGGDGALKTQWGNLDNWVHETDMGNQLYRGTCGNPTDLSCDANWTTPTAAQIPDANALWVFYRAPDNTLRGRLWYQGGWVPAEANFQGTLTGDPSATMVPGTNNIEVFYRGASNAWNGQPSDSDLGGALMTQWGNLNSWQSETPMPAGKLQGYWCAGYGETCGELGDFINLPAVPKTWVQPGTNNLWVFYRGQDGGILNSDGGLYAQERTSDGTWQPEVSLSGNPFDGDITPTTVPGSNVMQIFYPAQTCGWSCDTSFLATQWYYPQ